MINVSYDLTTFPDGTIQVWKASPTKKITWVWDKNKDNFLELAMLIDLLGNDCHLHIPYLPYARQDKDISNNQTFGLHTFSKLLNSLNINKITSFDVHSDVANKLIHNFTSIDPSCFHDYVMLQYKPDIIFYPDKGAAKRYNLPGDLYGEKVRNPSTGIIERYEIKNIDNIQDKKVLIIDDICDGGATFINAANELVKFHPKEIALCVSHGIFSKGLDNLKSAGISKFFYTNSLVENAEGYNVR